MTAALVLAAVAGFVDGFGFMHLGGYFLSFMSGTTTRVGVSLVEIQWPAAGFALLLILAFVGGAMVGTAASRRPFTVRPRLTGLQQLLHPTSRCKARAPTSFVRHCNTNCGELDCLQQMFH